jgi:phosphoglucomutase/phosphomannomutase
MATCLDQLNFDEETNTRIRAWLEGDYDAKTKAEIESLLRDKPKELENSFYTSLSFGTGGLRGLMGVGCNRMNVYTVRCATQGLANYIRKTVTTTHPPSVAIGYDSRHNSALFAQESARVLAGNGIKVFLFSELRPTPAVSFACRLKGCTAAIMITASHNPPAYNGYKVYWDDGAQILPPHDEGIISEVRKVTEPAQVRLGASSDPLIENILQDVDQAYIEALQKLQHYPQENAARGSELKIVYSNLHGTGGTLVPASLASWGFSSCEEVQAQAGPDADFSTVTSPNPEEESALSMGIKQMLSSNADLVMANDPDADRLGVVVAHEGKAHLLNGNQIASICLQHVCEALSQQERLPEEAAFVKTIVTSELFRSIAESYGKTCVDVLTGFKYVAEQIRIWEESENGKQYLFGGEESYGYLLGTDVRDKDGVGMCCLVAEIALKAKMEGKTLIDLLHSLFKRYGVYAEKLLSLKFPESKEGKQEMEDAMLRLRQSPPEAFLGSPVLSVEDYLSRERTLKETGRIERLEQPRSNVLLYRLADSSKVAIRPSGTEPKVKVYVGCVNTSDGDLSERIESCERHADTLLADVEKILKT